MSLLKPPSRRNNVKLVGGYLPTRLHNYLVFYSLAKGTSVTEILKELVFNWMTERREIENDMDLIRAIVNRVNIQWKVEKASGKGMTLSEFKDILRDELLEKGLTEEHTNLIISEVAK